MRKFYILFFLFLSNYSYSQFSSTWQVQNSFALLNDVEFSNSSTGCAVGYWGTILRTTNSGLNWKWMHCPSSGDLGVVKLIGNMGWIFGGSIFYSTDYGENWKAHPTQTSGTDIFFINVNTGWLAKSNELYKTTNAGSNWELISSANLDKVYFLTENTAIGVFENKILKTNNSGLNWDTLYTHTNNLYNINFSSNNGIGFIITEGGKILKTTNQGNNWNLITINPSLGLRSVVIKNETEIYAAGGHTQYYYSSTNGGNNWTQHTTSGVGATEVTNDFVISNGNFIQVGTGIYTSENNGTNWSYRLNSSISSPYWGFYNDVNFVNENTGYIGSAREGGFPYQGNNGYIFKTTNGGGNWNILLGTVNLVNSVEFVNDLTGWHTGYFASNIEQFINRTTNGGSNFALQATSWFAYDKIKMKDANTGFVSGTNFWKTTNSGVNWILSSGINVRSNGFDFSSDFQNIYAACNDAKFIKSTNGGTNFIQINLPLSYGDMYDVDFINEQTGFMVGENYAGIQKTTNGGYNWDYMTISPSKIKNSIQFINEQTGWIAGNNGSMFYTSNSGVNWIYVKAPVSYDLLDIQFINSNTGFCVGKGGTILYTNNGGVISVKNENAIEEKSYLLLKNYPNPFNPSTTITFSIPKNDSYELLIYDINGKLVDKIFSKQFSRGNHEVNWNADAFPSGVYFAKLSSENLSTSLKLLLVK